MTGKEREENAIEVQREYGFLAPGLLGTCVVCQQGYDGSPREFYHAVHETDQVFDEGSFSSSQCELCGSSWGGDRFAAHSIDPVTGKVNHWEICVDCLKATVNGEPYPDEG